MNRNELIEHIATLSILALDYKIAILCTTFEEAVELTQLYNSKMAEVPLWMPPEFTRRTKTIVETEHGKIMFIHSERGLIGQSVTHLFWDERCDHDMVCNLQPNVIPYGFCVSFKNE